jgi:Fur family peroxide stress response transcriptional regulator
LSKFKKGSILIIRIIINMNASIRKHSKKRDAILELVRSTNSHPGAQWIYDRLKPAIPDLSLGTVYRNIGIFREEGLLEYVGTVNGEERFDADTSPHSHAVCTVCGRVLDLPEAVRTKLAGGFQTEIPGFTIDMRHTVFYGLCKECSKQRDQRP